MKHTAEKFSYIINWIVERSIAALMLILVIDVWIGVVDRYVFHWQLPWPEVSARYLMIWMALLAISAGIARREHIGLTAVTNKIALKYRRPLLVLVEAITFAMFITIAWYGFDFADKGARKQAYIFELTLFLPYLSLPVAMSLAAIQTLLACLRDLGDYSNFNSAEFIE